MEAYASVVIERDQLRARNAELEAEVADLRDTENILGVKLAESVSDYEALEAELAIAKAGIEAMTGRIK